MCVCEYLASVCMSVCVHVHMFVCLQVDRVYTCCEDDNAVFVIKI